MKKIFFITAIIFITDEWIPFKNPYIRNYLKFRYRRHSVECNETELSQTRMSATLRYRRHSVSATKLS